MNQNLRNELKSIAEKLDGNISELFTSNSIGRTSRKIVIEYKNLDQLELISSKLKNKTKS